MPFHLLQGALPIQELADVQGTSQSPDTAWEQSNSPTWDSRPGEWGGGLVQDTPAFQTFLS